MALEIKWGRSPFWYGRFIRNGKKSHVQLGVRIEGTPPGSRRLRDRGDPAFEKSRVKAELRLEKVILELEARSNEEQLLRRIHQLKAGREIRSVELDQMFAEYCKFDREDPLTESTNAQSESRLKKFVAFIRSRKPHAKYMSDVDSLDAEDFMAALTAGKVTKNTFNKWLMFLRGIFRRLKKRAGLFDNPFDEIGRKLKVRPVGREAFTPGELEVILKVVKRPEHAIIRPIILTAICTAMRRGDCCNLLWKDVDFDDGFIDAVTNKTDEKITIPLATLLREELKKHLPAKGEYAFPAQRAMYESNPDGITLLIKRVLADAGFYDADVPGKAGHRGNITTARKGVRAASVRGCQAFRVTWATTALLSGINEELVRKVTGHQMVNTLRSYYFKPGREDLRREWTEKMPALFGLGPVAGTPTPEPITLEEKLKGMTGENWEQERDRILSLLNRAKT